ncbi:hypothetical protein [Photorhabdus stackebrandtii]|uniref:Uncharacterized protein n=1 Tax=Photorhabdus stackebrandtii TaxID=1123042 RepID=A0A7X5QIV3_9GAMM|nr:hypothetical protein [Photorhabdus stackebrandtii]NHB95070.1 hypothetical protein [Photorhabdus stackebrandtii]
MSTGEMIGCFALSEPAAGSNPRGMESTLTKHDNNSVPIGRPITNTQFYVLNSEQKVLQLTPKVSYILVALAYQKATERIQNSLNDIS